MADLSLRQYPWYFGNITRQEAEEHLIDHGENEGSFLVRDSTSRPGNWTISALNWDGKECSVGHYLVSTDESKRLFFEDDVTFDCIADLVEYYRDRTGVLTFSMKDPCPKNSRQTTDDYGYTIYEIPMEMSAGEVFVKEAMIYSGAYGENWRGHLESSPNQRLVAKIANDDEDSRHALTHEAHMLKIVAHENIVRLMGVISSPTVQLVLHDAGDMSLTRFLLNNTGQQLSTLDQLDIASQMASALDRCRRMKCVHRNVKAKSIIINTRDLKCKLSAFKHSRILDDHGYFHAVREDDRNAARNSSRIRWMAIEAAKDGRYSTASDVWSFAVLLQEIFSGGSLPYAGFLTCKVLSEVENGRRCPKPNSCPSEIHELMKRCWSDSEAIRPPFSEIRTSLKKYLNDNREILAKLSPARRRDWNRYSRWESVSIKQPRTTPFRPPPSPEFSGIREFDTPPPVPMRYGYDN